MICKVHPEICIPGSERLICRRPVNWALKVQNPTGTTPGPRNDAPVRLLMRVEELSMDARNEAPHWRKSSRSTNGACVEVAPRTDTVLVRDSKDPHGPVLSFDRAAFAAFVGGVADGEFDLPQL